MNTSLDIYNKCRSHWNYPTQYDVFLGRVEKSANKLLKQIMEEIFSDFPYSVDYSPFLHETYECFRGGAKKNNKDTIYKWDASIIVKALYMIILREKPHRIRLPYRCNKSVIAKESLRILFSSSGKAYVDSNNGEDLSQDDDLKQDLENLKIIIGEIDEDDVVDNTQVQIEWEQVQKERKLVQKERKLVQKEREQVQKEREQVQKEREQVQKEREQVQNEREQVQNEKKLVQKEREQVQNEKEQAQTGGEQTQEDREQAREEWHKHLSDILREITDIQPVLYKSMKCLESLYREIETQPQRDQPSQHSDILQEFKEAHSNIFEKLKELMSVYDKIYKQYVQRFAEAQINLYKNIRLTYNTHHDIIEKMNGQADTNYEKAVENYSDFLEMIRDALAEFGIEVFSTLPGSPVHGEIHRVLDSEEQLAKMEKPVIGKSVLDGFRYKDSDQGTILREEWVYLSDASHQ